MTARAQHFRHSAAGFTLIEVLVTMALMGVVLPVALNALSSANYAASFARHSAEAATLGQYKLNEIYASLISGQTDTSGGSGDFGVTWPDYTWQSTQNYDSDLAVTEIDVRVIWSQRGQERSILLSTLVADPTIVTGQ